MAALGNPQYPSVSPLALMERVIRGLSCVSPYNSPYVKGAYMFCVYTMYSRAVLEMQHSEGLNDLGFPKWQLAVCLGLVYVTLYLSLFKGVKSSGKYEPF
jgi:hypothetical protein